MKTSNDNSTHISISEAYPREPVPNVDGLKMSIIEGAKNLSQESPTNLVSRPTKTRLGKFRLVLPSLAISVVLLLITVGFLNLEVDQDTRPSLDIVSESELDWQELMLIEDELLFAGL